MSSSDLSQNAIQMPSFIGTMGQGLSSTKAHPHVAILNYVMPSVSTFGDINHQYMPYFLLNLEYGLIFG